MRERLKYIFRIYSNNSKIDVDFLCVQIYNLVISTLISKNPLRDHHVTTIVFHPNLLRNRFDILVEISATIRMHNNDMHTIHLYKTHIYTTYMHNATAMCANL